MIQRTKTSTIMNWVCSKKVPAFLFLLISGTLMTFNCPGQDTDSYNFNDLENLFEVHDHKPLKYTANSDKPKNEMEFLLASGFNVYKAFFSSQDNPSCIFHPSCSSYSVIAVQQKGVLVGTLSTFDRLTRCHRFVKTNQYIYDPSKQRFYDPVK